MTLSFQSLLRDNHVLDGRVCRAVQRGAIVGVLHVPAAAGAQKERHDVVVVLHAREMRSRVSFVATSHIALLKPLPHVHVRIVLEK